MRVRYVLVGSCGLVLAFGLGAAAQTAPKPVAVTSQAADPTRDYQLGAGDKIRVDVFGEDNLSGPFTVSSVGTLDFPLIGSVSVEGKTVGEVAELVRSRLQGGFLRQPRVTAEVMTYRPFYILGEVTKPGEYPYEAGMTIEKAIATAGGYTFRANQRRALLRHSADNVAHRIDVDSSTWVEPGDTIRIPERLF